MRHADTKLPFASHQRALPSRGAIEWEELPSLAERLVARSKAQAAESPFERSSTYNSPWDNTLPAPFDATPPPQPFREALHGLVMREVTEPDIFRHFFGGRAVA